MSFWLSDGKQHAEDMLVNGQSSQPVSWEVGVLPEGGFTSAVQVEDAFGQVLSDGEATFHVGAGQSTAGYADHDPQNYRLEVGEIAMRTEGGNIVHEEDEAFATERVDYYAEVVNSSDQWLGPVEVHFLVDGAPVGHGGMSHPGVGPGDTFWANGHTDPFAVGSHTLSIKIESSDPHLFVGSQRDVALTVLQPRSQGSVTEGNEDDIAGWTAGVTSTSSSRTSRVKGSAGRSTSRSTTASIEPPRGASSRTVP